MEPTTKLQIAAAIAGLNLNGYNWCYFEKGLHTFSRKAKTGYEVIKAKADDLTNGNLEFMIEHNLSR